MSQRPSRRTYLAALSALGTAGVAGCMESLEGGSTTQPTQTEVPPGNLGGANFTFEYSSEDKRVTIRFTGGAEIMAGDLEIRSSTGVQAEWAQLGSTIAGPDEQISAETTAIIDESTLNWGQAVGRNETIRIVYVGKETPVTLGRFTPPESSTLTSTVPTVDPTETTASEPTETTASEPTETTTPEPTETTTSKSTETTTSERTENPDTTPPSISAFSLSNPSGQELRISFESNETLTSIQVTIGGAESDVRTTDDFSEGVDGETYTYETTYQASADGDYTATLDEASDGSGNDGANGQSVSISVESSSGTVVVDDFEDTSELKWTVDRGTKERLEFSTVAAQGSHSLHFLEASEETATSISRSLTSSQTPSEFSIWFRYESSNDNNFRIHLHDSDGEKVMEFREFSGSMHYRDPTRRGGYVPHSDIARVDQNTWYELVVENIDFSNYTYDATVYDVDNTPVGSVEEIGFWTESDEVSEILVINSLGNNGRPDPLWIDNVTYTR